VASYEREIRTAARWWRYQVSGVRDGDPLQADRRSCRLAARETLTPPDDRELDRLESAIRDDVRAQLAVPGPAPVAFLGTTYAPDLALMDAADRAGISTRLFPLRVMMAIRAGVVRVRWEGGTLEPLPLIVEG